MHTLTVGQIMSTELVTLEEDENIALADTIMNLARIRHHDADRTGRGEKAADFRRPVPPVRVRQRPALCPSAVHPGPGNRLALHPLDDCLFRAVDVPPGFPPALASFNLVVIG